MKSLIEYIREGYNDWNCKYIQKPVVLKLISAALKQAKVTAEQVQHDMGEYKDPDDAWKAYEAGELEYYSAFEDAMIDILNKDAKYKEHADDIMDCIYDKAFDLMSEL